MILVPEHKWVVFRNMGTAEDHLLLRLALYSDSRFTAVDLHMPMMAQEVGRLRRYIRRNVQDQLLGTARLRGSGQHCTHLPALRHWLRSSCSASNGFVDDVPHPTTTEDMKCRKTQALSSACAYNPFAPEDVMIL